MNLPNKLSMRWFYGRDLRQLSNEDLYVANEFFANKFLNMNKQSKPTHISRIARSGVQWEIWRRKQEGE